MVDAVRDASVVSAFDDFFCPSLPYARMIVRRARAGAVSRALKRLGTASPVAAGASSDVFFSISTSGTSKPLTLR